MAAEPLRDLLNDFLGMSNEEILEKCGNGVPYLMKKPKEECTPSVSLLDIAEEI